MENIVIFWDLITRYVNLQLIEMQSFVTPFHLTENRLNCGQQWHENLWTTITKFNFILRSN